MDKPLDTIRWFLTAVVLLIVAAYVASALSCGGGAGPLADYLQTIWQAERIREDKAVLEQSVKTSQGILDRLIAGQLSLPQAAAVLRDEIESRPEHLRPPLYLYLPNLTEQERYMHQLLIRVNNHLDCDPRQGEVLKRLRKELASVSQAADAGK